MSTMHGDATAERLADFAADMDATARRLKEMAEMVRCAAAGGKVDIPTGACLVSQIWADPLIEFSPVELSSALLQAEAKTPADFAAQLRVALYVVRAGNPPDEPDEIAFFKRLMQHLSPEDGERWWNDDEANFGPFISTEPKN